MIQSLMRGCARRRSSTAISNRWFRPRLEFLETKLAPAATHFAVTGFPVPSTAGVPGMVTVTALNADNSIDTQYWRPFHFSSSDPWAGLPQTGFLTNGVGSFSVTPTTAGTRSITATDNLDNTITGSQTGITVLPAATTQFTVSGVTSAMTAGVPRNLTIQAIDRYGNATPAYAGTVHFTSSDGQAVLPVNSTLTNGVGTFSVTLKTAGIQSVIVTDTINSSITGNLAALPASMMPVYGQPHNGTTGHDKSSWYPPDGLDGDQKVWDDFTLSSLQSINEVRWLGLYDYNLIGFNSSPVFAFDISFWTTIAGSQPDVTQRPLQQFHVSSNANETLFTTIGNVRIYEYSYALPTPFRAAAGTRYWVQILASQGLNSNYWPPDWGLAYGSGGNGSHFREYDGGGGPVYQTITGDIAYQISTMQNGAGVVVDPAATARFSVTGFPSPAIAGTPGVVTVVAADAFGNQTPGYTGTVHLTSSDPAAILPADGTLIDGAGDFEVTLNTAGTQSIAATDSVNAAITGSQDGIVVTSAVPSVAGVVVNDGAAQRSRVTSLSLTFSTQVSFAGNVASAFSLTRVGGGAVTFTATASVIGGVTVVTLSGFTGPETQFTSLRDGRFTLTAFASQISAGGQALNNGVDFTFGDAQGLYRFFGDINGDRRVDIADYGLLSVSYLNAGNFVAGFDFNGDGRIDIADYGQFSLRYLATLP